jgi:membrane-bound serine protease (ClpP class)
VVTSTGEITLKTANLVVVDLPNTLVEQVLALLTNPNIVFVLLSIGVQAILIELSSPGGWVAGFIGAVCVALAVYGMGILPVNWFGLIFLTMSFVLFILDIKAPTHGALTAAGVGSFIAGSLILFNSPGVPSFQRVSVPLVVSMSLVTAALFLTILTFALRAQKKPVITGQEAMGGLRGLVRTTLNPEGTVQLDGELWSAELVDEPGPLPPGTPVEVVSRAGIHLKVRKAARQ